MRFPTHMNRPLKSSLGSAVQVRGEDKPSPSRLCKLLALGFTAIIASAPAAEEFATWNIRVAAVDIIPGHDTLWLRTGPDAELVQVPLNIRSFSPPVRYNGPAKTVFHCGETEASLQKPPAPLATATLRETSSLIVFSPRADGSGYQTLVIGDKGFPFGSFRFVNGSGIAVITEIDGRKLALKHGATETFTFRETKNSVPVRIVTAADGAAPRLIRQSSWSIDMLQRELILLTPGSAPGLVTLRHFIDSKAE